MMKDFRVYAFVLSFLELDPRGGLHLNVYTSKKIGVQQMISEWFEPQCPLACALYILDLST